MKIRLICEKCGSEYFKGVSGPQKEYWKQFKDSEKGLCDKCYEEEKQRQRERESAEAAAKAKEQGLPPLEGTKAQIKWAETIRQYILSKFEGMAETALVKQNMFLYTSFMEAFRKEARARWFIDHRDEFYYLPAGRFIDFMTKYLDEVSPKLMAEKEKTDPVAVDAKTEATVMPENAITAAAAEICVSESKIVALFEKNDVFIKVVKSSGYKWTGVAWEKQINELTGSTADRAAELGNKLLNAGIPVIIMDENIRKAATNGEYEPECSRWIFNVDENKLKIKWGGCDSRLYDVARKLPGSKWDNGVVVSVSHYQEVEEFAKLYGFRFTQKALEAIEAEKQRIAQIQIVKPAQVEDSEQKDGLKEILNSPSDILPDLLDD